jgi:hypothetical protein
MTDLEFAQLTAVLEANQDDEAFAVELTTGMGAENLLQQWDR